MIICFNELVVLETGNYTVYKIGGKPVFKSKLLDQCHGPCKCVESEDFVSALAIESYHSYQCYM